MDCFAPFLRWLPALAAVSLAAACGGAPSATRAPSPPVGVERYFPLIDGTIYTYQAQTPHGPEAFMIRVRRVGPDTAQLRTDAGLRTLAVRSDSIQRAGGGFVLRAPLQKGASWQGDKGVVRVIDDNQRITVPAGTFQGCLQTVEEVGGDARGRITTSYCPEVGIVSLLVEEWHGADQISQLTELRAFGPPTDLR
ncbi:MAG TPA: hypothetical protein PLI95_03585 [Polyangiaceae bacterium]|nr:hypothetical protein [Polyangiaceae bacterium]